MNTVQILNKYDTSEKALLFVQQQGLILVSVKEPVPRQTEAILGETIIAEVIRSSWWTHPQSHYLEKSAALVDFALLLPLATRLKIKDT